VIAEETLEEDNPSRAIVINNLALVLESKAEYSEVSSSGGYGIIYFFFAYGI
jgi:hypothetical protein